MYPIADLRPLECPIKPSFSNLSVMRAARFHMLLCLKCFLNEICYFSLHQLQSLPQHESIPFFKLFATAYRFRLPYLFVYDR